MEGRRHRWHEQREEDRQRRQDERQRRREAIERAREQRWQTRVQNVVTCRLDDDALSALDALVEAGVRSTRSEAAAWLIKAGLEANQDLLREVSGTVAEIRRLRGVAMEKAQRLTASPAAGAGSPPPGPTEL
jgi:hypothetical protein